MGLLNLFGRFKRAAPAPVAPKFTELGPDEVARLEKHRAVVIDAAKRRYGTARLKKTRADLAALQRLLDDRAFAKTEVYELQCLGTVFGDVLTSEFPLRWMMVSDEFGTDPMLRYKDTTLRFNVLTMISKRVERGEDVDVTELYRLTGEQVAQLAQVAD